MRFGPREVIEYSNERVAVMKPDQVLAAEATKRCANVAISSFTTIISVHASLISTQSMGTANAACTAKLTG